MSENGGFNKPKNNARESVEKNTLHISKRDLENFFGEIPADGTIIELDTNNTNSYFRNLAQSGYSTAEIVHFKAEQRVGGTTETQFKLKLTSNGDNSARYQPSDIELKQRKNEVADLKTVREDSLAKMGEGEWDVKEEIKE